jgi:phage antirepressor YoqD-like protein
VYSLIFGSKLESAKDFKRWVTSDVLPVIRKHGGYLTPQTIEEVLLSPDTIIRLATDLKEERQKRLDAETLIEIQKPKVKYYDEVLSSDNLMTVTEIAKNYGWSADALNGILRGIGVQYKRGAKWFLKAKYQDKDYVRIVPVVVDAKNGNQIIRNDMKWTETGRKFIHEILVSKGHINRQQSF